MKQLVIILLLLVTTRTTFSCDYCNCYLGLNPHYKKNIIGLRYYNMNYSGTHESADELQEMNLSKDDFWETRTRLELHGQLYATPKLKLIFSAPYVINKEGINGDADGHNHTHAGTGETMNHRSETINGIGDPMIIAHYQLFNSSSDSLHFNQRLLAGGGIKFPLGKWKLEEGAESHERVHQPGTGSWDFIMSTEYIAKYKKTGMNVNASYMMSTTNSQFYSFANRFNANMVYFYQVNKNETSIYPSLGLYYEQAGKDTDHHMPVENSGGKILFAHAGIDFYFKNFSINTAFQLPVMQNLNEPQPEINYRLIAGINYAFN